MQAAQVNAHCFGLGGKLRVDVGEWFVVLLVDGNHVCVGLRDGFFVRFIVLLWLIDLAEKVLPVLGIAERKVDLAGVELHRIFLNFDASRGSRLHGLAVEVEVFGKRRVVIEAHLLRALCGLEDFRGVDVAGLGGERLIHGRGRFVDEPAHRTRIIVGFLRRIAIVLHIEYSPFDAGVLNANVRAGEFVEGLEECCAALGGDRLRRLVCFELRWFRLGFVGLFVGRRRYRNHRFLLGQVVEGVERIAAAATAHPAGGLPQDLCGYAKRGATFGTLGVHL